MILEILVTGALVVLGVFAFVSTIRSRRRTGDPGVLPIDPGGPIQTGGFGGTSDGGAHHGGGFDGGGGFHGGDGGGGGFDGGGGGAGGHHG